MHRHPALLTLSLMALLATPLFATWEDGVAAYRAGRYDDAASVFQSFVSSSPTAPEGHYMLGLSLLRQNQMLKALEPLSEALKLSENDLRYRMTLAQALLKAGKFGDAFDTLAAQDLSAIGEAERASFNKLLAKAAISSKRHGAAFDHLEKALAVDPGSRTLWLAHANVASRLDRPQDAFSAMSKAFQLDPSDSELGYKTAYTAMRVAQDSAGDQKVEWYGKAAGIAGKLAKAAPTLENLRMAASAHMGAKEYEQAATLFERALAMETEDPLPHFDLGRCRQAQGRHREALAHFGAALKRSPDTELAARLHAQRGAALRVLEDFDGSAAAYRLAGMGDAATEMEGYAQNRREWEEDKADCIARRTGLEDILASSDGLEHTREYKEVEQNLSALLSACEPFFSDQS